MQTINKTAKLSQSCKVDRVLYTLPYLPERYVMPDHHFAYRSEEKMMPSLLGSVEKVTSVTAVRMSWVIKGAFWRFSHRVMTAICKIYWIGNKNGDGFID
ncbi:TPA: hypothetical protein QHR58_004253 [Enterobacter kobei]|nr:hypothetical protein [Enterobacter kobei]